MTGGTSGSGSAGSGGGGLSFDAGDAPADAASCVFPTPDDADDGGAAMQSWCAPGAINSPECPAAKPLAGAPCSTMGLQCAYAKDSAGFLLETCDTSWVEVAHWCGHTCTPSDLAVATPTPPACGGLADIPCAGGNSATHQERADRTLREIATCCGAHNEAQLIVWLKDGCASAISGPPDLVACMNGLLAGRQLGCAKELSCATAEWSTLP